MYQKYLELGQGKIMEDLNTSRATLNTLTILRDIQYDNLDKDPNHASYYWNQINKLTQQRNQEISRIDTLNPTLSNLNEVWGKAKAANYPESATAAYKKTQYKENTVQQNYLK